MVVWLHDFGLLPRNFVFSRLFRTVRSETCYRAITAGKIAKSDLALAVGGFADDELRRE